MSRRNCLPFVIKYFAIFVSVFLFLPCGYTSAAEIISENNLMSEAIPGSLCQRKCEVGDVKVCRFTFLIKHNQVLSGACGNCSLGVKQDCLKQSCVTADGYQRGILSINFQLPGPPIVVCRNDVVIVDVQNAAEGISTSLHFHGMRQIGSQFMDGVPYLTQCPIPYGSIFRYIFNARDEGTHFYHSHSGHQKSDGLFGSLIVKEPEDSRSRDLYDEDLPQHIIVLSDWQHQMADNSLPGMVRRSSLTESILVNGRGRFSNATKDSTPLTIFHVQSGLRYRFRLINSAFNVCPFQFQIEDHNFTVVATELSFIDSVEADTLNFLSGERFDIVVNANRAAKDYLIRVRQLAPCWKEIDGYAILRYHDDADEYRSRVTFGDFLTPEYQNEYPKNKIFNSLRPESGHVSLTDTKSLDTDEGLLTGEPDHKFHLVFDSPAIKNDIMYATNNRHNFIFVTSDFSKHVSFVATINNITFQFPSFPLLTEKERIHEAMFCDVHNMDRRNCVKNSNLTVCKCIHRLKVKLNSIVEIVAFNTMDKIPHPLHLHGHKFHVLDSGVFNESFSMSFDEFKNLNISKKNAESPPYKDTCILPFPGYVRFRFRATNPGFWLFHCHYDFHLPIGMALVLQVGELDEMTSPPKDFPTCHDFLPTGMT